VRVALVARADLARAMAATAVTAEMAALLMVGRGLVREALVGQLALVVQVAQVAARAKPGRQAKWAQPKAHSRAPRMRFVGIRFLRVVMSQSSGVFLLPDISDAVSPSTTAVVTVSG
jgi:hypothetical protein